MYLEEILHNHETRRNLKDKKMLQDNKKSWHNKLVNALWADKLRTKNKWHVSIPFILWHGHGFSNFVWNSCFENVARIGG